MKSTKLMMGFALAAALMIPLAGCGGKARLSAANMCKAAGGTYSAASQTCDAPAVNAKKAAAMCDAHGGTYMADLQVCEVEGTK
jgi:hypothetical protein